MATRNHTGKGSFGSGLPVADRYVPRRRRWLVLASATGLGIAALGFTISWLAGGSRVASPGQVSSAHANFEAACATCHVPLRGAADERCLACHGRVAGDIQRYGFAAHYRRSGQADPEQSGVGPRPAPDLASREAPCADCHREHRGRSAALAAVDDGRCAACHGFDSFTRGHPEFAFARLGLGDDPNLFFGHRLHVAEVSERLGLDHPELACLQCHEPDSSGRAFQPIDFDRHCDACHLTANDGTPPLPVGDPADPQRPGVLSLDEMRARWEPGMRWALFANPDEMQRTGARLQKRPVYHEDPWVLTNLRHIRSTLLGDLGLAGLLDTAVDEGAVVVHEQALYREVIAELEGRIGELRGIPAPEVQAELRRLEELLAVAEGRLETGAEPVSAAPFRSPSASEVVVEPERAAALRRLALDLTTPCRRCHVVSDAAIQRVQKDQRSFLSAEFDHRAHVIQVPSCTSCHHRIAAILDGRPKRADDPQDVAKTLNLPTIAVCRDCHTPQEAASSCATCHRFHPGNSRHAGMVVLPNGGG